MQTATAGFEGSAAIVTTEEKTPDIEGLSPPSTQALALQEQQKLAEHLIAGFRRRRAGWLGHLHAFTGVNVGLAAINILAAISSGVYVPWVLYVVASWGMGLAIHGLSYRRWVQDHGRSLRSARRLLGDSHLPALSMEELDEGERATLPDGLAAVPRESALPAVAGAIIDESWSLLLGECQTAVDAAHQALDRAAGSGEATGAAREQLTAGLRTAEIVYQGAQAIHRAIAEVAPDGVEALEQELLTVDSKVAEASSERLQAVYAANRSLLQGRRDKLGALLDEEERMRATVEGFLLAAQNIRLDATRLGAGLHVPTLTTSLGDSLARLNDEVDVFRQVESELAEL